MCVEACESVGLTIHSVLPDLDDCVVLLRVHGLEDESGPASETVFAVEELQDKGDSMCQGRGIFVDPTKVGDVSRRHGAKRLHATFCLTLSKVSSKRTCDRKHTQPTREWWRGREQTA